MSGFQWALERMLTSIRNWRREDLDRVAQACIDEQQRRHREAAGDGRNDGLAHLPGKANEEVMG